MVRVGEMTGRLEETFLRLYNHLEFERDMRERIRDALRYPAFVVVAMAVAIVIINLFVIPAFAKVYAGFKAELPFMTQILIGFSNFMVNQWPLLLAMLASAVIGFKMYTATPAGRYQWDKLKLRLPVAGKISLKAALARFARSFSLAFKSGVPAVQSLSVVDLVVTTLRGPAHRAMRDGWAGSVLRTAVTTGVLPGRAADDCGWREAELDDLMGMPACTGGRWNTVKNLSANIEPILIVGLGILVLILASACSCPSGISAGGVQPLGTVKNHTPGARRQRFYLIELMVVISIVAIVGAVLLDRLQTIRNRRKRRQCGKWRNPAERAELAVAEDWSGSGRAPWSNWPENP